MMHRPIQIQDLELSFPHKTCFENFSCQIPYGSRIAIIGRNGSGKSTLLKMIARLCEADAVVGYVPQIIVEHGELSGGERLGKAVAEALNLHPHILLLDEPTNHLDHRNRKNLMCRLRNYPGTLIVVSHDKELLRSSTDILWHIDHGRVHIFSGNYDDYIREIKLRRTSVKGALDLLARQEKEMHHKLMQEQERASKRKAYGEKKYKDDKLALRCAQARGEQTHSEKKVGIRRAKERLLDQLESLRLPEVIVPQFSIEGAETARKTFVQISGGSVGYCEGSPLLSRINLSLYGNVRVAVMGDNGSGKSTLIKAILGEETLYKTGEWYVLKREDIGYLDQNYETLSPNKTVLETLSDLVPHWSHAEVRRHLNDFLFRKNEEVAAPVGTLSGGEKARLSLAQIAAKTPKLLILDEVANNLDLETKDHVIQVLKAFPGAMIVISHDNDFLEEIGIDEIVNVEAFA